MNRSKLLTFLRNLTNSQIRQFRKYLQSPFFNENAILLLLYDHLIENVASKLKKKEVWENIFPDRTYNDQEFRLLNSQLLQHGLRYLGLEQLELAPITQELLKLKAVNSPQLEKHFRGVVRNLERLTASNAKEEPIHYFHLSELERIRHTHREQEGKRLRSLEHLEEADRHLDRFYIAQKLKNYCDLLGYQKSLSTTGEIRLPEQFLTFVREEGYLEVPIVRVYYLIARMLLNPEEEIHFSELRETLVLRGEAFAPEEQQALFVHLINYCIDTKINIGRQEYFQELFAIYRSALKQGIIFRNEELDPQHYKNIITIGLYLREFDWTEQFIQTYTPSLPADQQENALNYNLAKVYFRQENYEAVISQLREVEYRNITYALGSKLMLLKTYYELSEYRALDSLSDSFRIYLLRNRLISKEVKQQYLNVLRFTRKLSTVAPYDDKALLRIRDQIHKCKALADKAWILEKLEELSPGSGKGNKLPSEG